MSDAVSRSLWFSTFIAVIYLFIYSWVKCLCLCISLLIYLCVLLLIYLLIYCSFICILFLCVCFVANLLINSSVFLSAYFIYNVIICLCSSRVQFANLHNLQNALHDLSRVRISVRFGSEICKLHVCNFKIVQRVLQIAQIDSSCATCLLCHPCNDSIVLVLSGYCIYTVSQKKFPPLNSL